MHRAEIQWDHYSLLSRRKVDCEWEQSAAASSRLVPPFSTFILEVFIEQDRTKTTVSDSREISAAHVRKFDSIASQLIAMTNYSSRLPEPTRKEKLQSQEEEEVDRKTEVWRLRSLVVWDRPKIVSDRSIRSIISPGRKHSKHDPLQSDAGEWEKKAINLTDIQSDSLILIDSRPIHGPRDQRRFLSLMASHVLCAADSNR